MLWPDSLIVVGSPGFDPVCLRRQFMENADLVVLNRKLDAVIELLKRIERRMPPRRVPLGPFADWVERR